MKNLIYSFIVLMGTIFSSSAQMFAPAGSEWYRAMSFGVFHNYNAGDTVIHSRMCHKIMRKALTADPEYSMGLRVDDHSNLYVYNTADTVFVYNIIFGKFTPLYVFNVSDGDVVRLPILPIDIGLIMYDGVDTAVFNGSDSTFRFRVDSVRMKLYDTVMLKTIYTTPLGDPDTNFVYSYSGAINTQGAYAERIGSITYGLLPMGWPANIPTSEAIQPEGAIKCYSDPTLSVKLVPGICGIPPVQVSVPMGETPVVIFPNPASDVITISNAAHKQLSVALVDIAGRTVAQYAGAENMLTIPVGRVPDGMYLVRIVGDGNATVKKITVMH